MDKSRLVGAVRLCVLVFVTSTSYAAGVSGQGTWETTLLPRDLDGNPSTAEAYYDTDLDITWLADANYADTIGPPPYPEDGRMNMPTAKNWANSLSIGGVTGWRLPITAPVDGSLFNNTPSIDGSTDIGYNLSAPGSAYPGTTVSELAHMYYVTLGNTGRFDLAGNFNAIFGLTNTGPFAFPNNPYYPTLPYWTEILENPSDSEGGAYVFTLNEGQQRLDNSINGLLYTWPVHDGDVAAIDAAAVPLPPALYLFGYGLLGLIGVSRRKTA